MYRLIYFFKKILFLSFFLVSLNLRIRNENCIGLQLIQVEFERFI